MNDYEMLSMAARGFVMNNATERLKRALPATRSPHICDDDGVARQLIGFSGCSRRPGGTQSSVLRKVFRPKASTAPVKSRIGQVCGQIMSMPLPHEQDAAHGIQEVRERQHVADHLRPLRHAAEAET